MFFSCEKETHVKYFIHNQSSFTVQASGSDIIHSTEIDDSIGPNENKEVSGWSKRAKETDLFEPVSMFGNDLLITNEEGDTLTKDYRILSNWQSDVDNRRSVASHEYVLFITDSDF